MRDKDDKLMEEAFDQIQEGIFDRMKARGGTIGQKLGAKALSGLGKVAGDTRMGQALTQAGEAGKMDVQEQRASQLMTVYKQKLDKLYADMENDANKVGVDIKTMAQQDFQSKGTGGEYPKLAGLSAFLRQFNKSRQQLGE